jgi:hypothetical protein
MLAPSSQYPSTSEPYDQPQPYPFNNLPAGANNNNRVGIGMPNMQPQYVNTGNSGVPDNGAPPMHTMSGGNSVSNKQESGVYYQPPREVRPPAAAVAVAGVDPQFNENSFGPFGSQNVVRRRVKKRFLDGGEMSLGKEAQKARDDEKKRETLDMQPISEVLEPRLYNILKDYQVLGVQFVFDAISPIHRQPQGFGCILADYMGLGKTLQSICALLLFTTSQHEIVHEGRPTLPKTAMVLMPSSVIRNWEDEIMKWAPQLKEKLYVLTSANAKVTNEKKKACRHFVCVGLPSFLCLVENQEALLILFCFSLLPGVRHPCLHPPPVEGNGRHRFDGVRNVPDARHPSPGNRGKPPL